jgi:hypothetical protein
METLMIVWNFITCNFFIDRVEFPLPETTFISKNSSTVLENVDTVFGNIDIMSENSNVIVENTDTISENSNVVLDDIDAMSENFDTISENVNIVSQNINTIFGNMNIIQNQTPSYIANISSNNRPGFYVPNLNYGSPFYFDPTAFNQNNVLFVQQPSIGQNFNYIPNLNVNQNYTDLIIDEVSLLAQNTLHITNSFSEFDMLHFNINSSSLIHNQSVIIEQVISLNNSIIDIQIVEEINSNIDNMEIFQENNFNNDIINIISLNDSNLEKYDDLNRT